MQELLKSNSCTVILGTLFSFCLEKAKGVGALPILPNFKMQMVSGRVAGGTDIADHFALLHFLPHGYADRGTVGIQGVEGIVVVELDMVSIPTAPRIDGVGDGDGAVRSRKDGRSTRSADIGSAVVGNFPGEGVLPVAEA